MLREKYKVEIKMPADKSWRRASKHVRLTTYGQAKKLSDTYENIEGIRVRIVEINEVPEYSPAATFFDKTFRRNALRRR